MQGILHFTHHSRSKMQQYRLSEGRVKRILHAPKRVEEGIALNTIAMMQPASLKSSGTTQTWTQEIWVMIEKVKSSKVKIKNDGLNIGNLRMRKPEVIKVISAWRYPGVSKPRDEVTKKFLRSRYDDYISQAR